MFAGYLLSRNIPSWPLRLTVFSNGPSQCSPPNLGLPGQTSTQLPQPKHRTPTCSEVHSLHGSRSFISYGGAEKPDSSVSSRTKGRNMREDIHRSNDYTVATFGIPSGTKHHTTFLISRCSHRPFSVGYAGQAETEAGRRSVR